MEDKMARDKNSGMQEARPDPALRPVWFLNHLGPDRIHLRRDR